MSAANKIDTTAWAIATGNLLCYGTFSNRSDAIADKVHARLLKLSDADRAEWARLKRGGYRCVRVRVTEI